MLILAVDQSIARTGWCLYEPPAHVSMLIGSFTSRPDNRVVYDGFRLDAESLIQMLRPLAA